eukprot:CAMPEP_0173162778 /NCGR_PEP_ID=MMETSP1105-20130129/19519_1 /TAXON_ID=2985 /ORGANISM="Ochromonas sp., Strain BG-1" /LENGTH=617 /DNA_ID=CAMNT_0014082691 /DNA_START=170 /DNA_END=2023 /DNA_ORIENTATION=+
MKSNKKHVVSSSNFQQDVRSLKNSSRTNRRCLIGSVIHSIAFGEIEIIDHGAIVYDLNGVIQQVIDLKKHPLSSEALASFEQVQDFTGKLIIPGFVDAHCHAPQYVFSGTGMDLPLLQWLEKYTFPCEAKFRDEAFARLAYEKSIKRHLKCGTTFASYFATIHLNACKVLVDVINEVGQRAHVGKVSMDRNSPDFYIEETEEGGEAAEEFVQYVLSQTEVGRKLLFSTSTSIPARATRAVSFSSNIDLVQYNPPSYELSTPAESHGRKRVRAVSLMSEEDLSIVTKEDKRLKTSPVTTTSSDDSVMQFVNIEEELSHPPTPTLLNRQDTPLIIPCITPRFVPTCTKDIMQRLGEIAKKYGLPVQSHMSESVNEIAWVAELHPECDTYAGVYEQYGLLHEKAYMAHCCHSSKEEREILRKTGASAVHCASSNFMLSSGVMDVRQFLEEGIKVALGTDVAGGYSPSMLDALRQAVIASRVKGFEYKKMMKEQEQEREVVDSSRLSPSESGDDASLSSVSSPSTPSSSSALVEKDYKSLNYVEAFHLATVGGAEVLGMGDVVGNFMVGKKLDCLIIDVHHEDSPIDIFEHESSSEHFQKFLFLGDDRNIAHVFVDGKCVI